MSQVPFEIVWLQDGKVLCYRLYSTGAATADEWFADMLSAYETWDRSDPIRILIDLRDPGNILSPEAMVRARELSHAFPEVGGRIALLLDPSTSDRNLTMFLEKALEDNQRERRPFTSETEALDWLRG